MLSCLLVFLLVWFYCFFLICKDFHGLLVFLIGLVHIFDYQTICTSRKSWNEVHLFVCECAPAHIWMPCVQLHKYVFCFLGATNKALKKIQSTYLNNCSLTHACTRTHTNLYITHCDRAPLNNMCAPVQSLPLLSCSTPGSRCLGTAYSLSEFLCTKQTAALSTSGCNGKFALEMGGRGGLWVSVRYHEDGRRGEKSEKEGAPRGETVSRLQVCCIGKIPVSRDFGCTVSVCSGMASYTVYTVSLSDIMQHQGNRTRWPCYISDCMESMWPLSACSVCSLVWIALWKVADKHKVKGKKWRK